MKTQQAKPYAVFLSFNSEDREAVKTLAEYLLDNADLRPWLDEWELIAGEPWVRNLERGLEASQTCAVFVGKSGQGSWQEPEVEAALRKQRKDPKFRVIPVLLPNASRRPKLPGFLSGNMWVDFRGKELHDDNALWRLECGIRGVAPGRGRPQPAECIQEEPSEQDQMTPGFDPMPLRNAYLRWLLEQSSQLSLAGIDKKAAGKGAEDHLNLSAIYTALLTREAEHDQTPGSSKKPSVSPDGDLQRRLSAVAQLNRHARLVLLGDPGSGKSTFVNFVVLCLAGELLQEELTPQPPLFSEERGNDGGIPQPPLFEKRGDQGVSFPNLRLLTAPLPDDKGKDAEEPQPWNHGALLPVRVILRDFAARGLPPAGQEAKAKDLWQFIVKELQANMLGDYAPYLRQHLQNAGGLILLDGLDEVPEADRRRTQIKEVVEDVGRCFPNCRVLVTSRTYAYQEQHWRLSRFKDATLAAFSQGQIRRFVERWYAYIGPLRGLSADDARGRAERLKRAILNSDRLYSLAERPLLLTLMASLHAWRGGSLPEKREELYNDTVDLLLDWWESAKMVTSADGSRKIVQPSLTELLNVGKDCVRAALNALAFRAHKDQQQLQGTADITETDLVAELMELRQNPDLKPGRLIEHLRDRAGLLVPRGVKVYTFPHRTFQEYLAACYLTEALGDDEQYPENVAALARKEPNRWREAALLAGAKATRGSAPNLWALADALCFTDFPSREGTGVGSHEGELAQDAWGALLAGQLLVENASLQKISPRNQAKIKRICAWLVPIMTEQVPSDCVQAAPTPFPAIERALAGNLLAVLGDPRPGVGLRADGLPEIVWCEVPAGAFLMGSDPDKDPEAMDREQPQHEVRLPAFKMSRYPVTNAQYQAFVDAGGTKPEKYSDPFGLSNHPVVGVNWDDAMAFCAWLTEQLRKTGELQATEVVRLPSEAEWEKAARGTDARLYPWGNAHITPELANYGETGLGATSAVGCFPRGASPYGCEDMSGNVWEWCLDSWVKDYKDGPINERSRGILGDEKAKVLRGGAWTNHPHFCRCAFRNTLDPDYRDDVRGLRVVAAVAWT